MTSRQSKKLQHRIAKLAKYQTTETPTVLCPAHDEDHNVIFSFQDLEPKYSFSTKKCNHQLRIDLLNKLHTISQQNWETLEHKGKKSGFESIPTSALKINPATYPALNGVNKLHVLRFNGQSSRLIGYRLGRVFYIMFIDPDLSLYQH